MKEFTIQELNDFIVDKIQNTNLVTRQSRFNYKNHGVPACNSLKKLTMFIEGVYTFDELNDMIIEAATHNQISPNTLASYKINGVTAIKKIKSMLGLLGVKTKFIVLKID